MQNYKTIAWPAEGEFEEKKSKFIASIAPVETEQQALDFLQSIREKHRTANHNVYAYRLRSENRERFSDDGEPAKTAGAPALEVLRHKELVDVIVVITRYFGGTLLGTGGLVRAYGGAVSAAIENAECVVVQSLVTLSVVVEYSLYERAVIVIENENGKLEPPLFAEYVKLSWQMPEGSEEKLIADLTALTRGAAEISVSEPFFAPF